MTGSSRPSANRAGPGLVVMGCADEDAESLHEAVDALRRDGLEVELCPGLDHDPRRLSDVIDQHEGHGLYVLCRSPALGRERVEELREILLARHVPFARTLTVAVGGRGALADRIRSGLRRASARSSGPNRAVGGPVLRTTNATEDEEPTLVGKRDGAGVPEPIELVPSTPMPLPPRAAAPARPAVEEADEIAEADADEDPELTEDTNASWNGAAIASLDLSDLDEATGRGRLPKVDTTTAVGTPPALITGDTVVGRAPAMITGDTLVGQKLPRLPRDPSGRLVLPPLGPTPIVDLPPPGATAPMPRMPAAATSLPSPGATAPMPRMPAAATSLPPPGATAPMPRMPAAAPSLPPPGATAPMPRMTAAATSLPEPSLSPAAPAPLAQNQPPPSAALPPELPPVAAPVSSPAISPSLPPPPSASAPVPSPAIAPSLPPPPSTPAAPPPFPASAPTAWGSSAEGSAGAATAASHSHGDLPPTRSKVLPWALGGVALLLLALVIGLALSSGRSGSEEVAAKDDAPREDAPTPPSSSSPTPTTPTPEDAPADANEAAEEEAATPPVYPVVVALESRKVRALDVLLIASAWSKPSDWSSAVAYCEALEIEGLRGWRLPHIGELHSLAQASMIARGMFWSSTAADTFGDGHMAWNARRGHALPHSEDAVAVCVRGGASGS